MSASLKDKISARQATVGVCGLGYVGLPLCLSFAARDFQVIGFDIDPDKVAQIEKGESYIKHIGPQRVAQAVASGRLQATTDFARSSECDALIVCVPTPLNPSREPDLSFVENTTRQIAPHLRADQLFVLESTTWPGTTREVVVPLLAASGLEAGRDFFVGYSPEREDPGNKDFNTQAVPKVVSGYSSRCSEAAQALYAAVFEQVVAVESLEVAEAAKLLENIYRSVNIALVNELKVLLTRMDIDIWQVVEAAATKPFGFAPFYPGPGLGGHCIPIDPFYLTWRARQFGLNTRFIELAGQINTHMPEYVIGRLSEALNEVGKPIKGSRVLVMGITYKPDVDDTRESPSVVLMELLLARGALVSYNDPFITTFPQMRGHDLDLESQELTRELLAGVDCVLLATDHSQYDYGFIGEHAPLIIDTRNALADWPQYADKVWKA
ncbi:MAG: nucleotide sugar dehydrogenase [Candidatus Latescibacteria bacterium]|nr:nucleotide sugar dehydrogenase [Candidatus Latescibacterota bacterium]